MSEEADYWRGMVKAFFEKASVEVSTDQIKAIANRMADIDRASTLFSNACEAHKEQINSLKQANAKIENRLMQQREQAVKSLLVEVGEIWSLNTPLGRHLLTCTWLASIDGRDCDDS